MTVNIHRDANTQRMYFHSLILKENLLTPRVSKAQEETSCKHTGSLTSADIHNILHAAITYNLNNITEQKYSCKRDTTKAERLEKLRKAPSIHITGNEIEASDDLKQYKKNALEYGKKLRGTYTNKDTGQKIAVGRKSILEIVQHDIKNSDHLQSIAAIP